MEGRNGSPVVRVRRYSMPEADDPPLVSVLVPSLDGLNNGRLAALDRDLRRQRFRNFEVVQVVGDTRQGRAINRAARLSRGAYLLTLDDDTVLPHPDTFGRVVSVLERDPTVGIAGASTMPPPGCSAFQRIALRQIPRAYFPVLRKTVDSDMAQHGCMAVRRKIFEAVGGEDEELVRGLDPLLRYKVRQLGYRVVIAAGAWISHPLPDNLGALIRRFFRNGRGSAFAQLRHPERVIELSDGFRRNRFTPRRPLWYRAARYLLRLYVACLELQVVRIAVSAAYLAGYIYETAASKARRFLPARTL